MRPLFFLASRITALHLVSDAIFRVSTALRHRPLVGAAMCFAMGVWVGEWLWTSAVLTAAALVCLVLRLPYSARSPRIGAFLVGSAFAAAFAAAGALRMQVQTSPGPHDISRWIGPEFVTVTGRPVSEPELQAGRRGYRFVMSAHSIRLPSGVVKPCSGLLQCSVAAMQEGRLRYGDMVSISGAIEAPQPPTAPGAPPTDAQLRRHGVFATMTARYPSLWRVQPAPLGRSPILVALTRRALQWRASMMGEFERRIPRPYAALATGIVLGGRQAMSPADVDAFTRSGLIHLVAASGANVAILLGAAFLIARRASLSRSAEALVCSAVVVAYAVAAGSEPAVVRAAVMAVAYIAAPLLDRDRDAPCALAAAALASLAWAPGNLWDAGFQLSFAIVAALLAVWPIWASAISSLWPPLRRVGRPSLERLPRALALGFLSAIGVSAIAGLASAPLTAQTFSSIPTMGIVANALAAPIIAALLPTALVAWLACLIVPPIGDLMTLQLVAPMVHYVSSVAHWISGVPGAVLHVSPPGWPAVWACYLLMATLLAISVPGDSL